ncbi:MAG: hypothetical protein R3D98_08060 [Candidatus Krumholzibacteriia bacterium]
MQRAILFTILMLAAAGCDRGSDTLTVADLTANESRYVQRFMVLERARALALADPDQGEAALDSLAAAWGDSAAVEAGRLLPTEPRRAQLVDDLLRRLLEAESDSLTHAPRRDRLAAPLPPG